MRCVLYDTHMTLTFNDTEKSADLEKFEKITYPTFFFGFNIRNLYDQKRLKIKDEFNPKYIVHKYGSRLEDMLFLYGITSPVSNEVMPYVLPLQANPNVNQEQYEAVLAPMEVECSDCYLFLSKNVYPINTFYSHLFFKNKSFKDLTSYNQMLERDSQLPMHHTIAPFHMFLLTDY